MEDGEELGIQEDNVVADESQLEEVNYRTMAEKKAEKGVERPWLGLIQSGNTNGAVIKKRRGSGYHHGEVGWRGQRLGDEMPAPRRTK